jgi:transposase InsO family protein
VVSLIEIAKIARSTYYYYLKTFNKPDKYADVKQQILGIWHKHKGRYGYRRITLELRNRGTFINHKTVQKLMRMLELKCMVRIKKYKSYKGDVGKIAPNIINRDFSTAKPNQKWVTDVTEFSLFGQKIYLSTILDLFNGEIISYNITQRPTFHLVKDMLETAFSKISSDTNLVLHSDQGWHYQMKQYQRMLIQKGIKQSMSRKGNCLDNAVMENFFGHLKSELLYLQKFENLEHFVDELHEYIYYYNNHRIKAKLKGLSPVSYRNQSLLIA